MSISPGTNHGSLEAFGVEILDNLSWKCLPSTFFGPMLTRKEEEERRRLRESTSVCVSDAAEEGGRQRLRQGEAPGDGGGAKAGGASGDLCRRGWTRWPACMYTRYIVQAQV